MSNNDNFSKLLVHLQGMGEEAYISPQSHADYQKFITQFPAQTLETLTLDQYCVGKGSRESFCWWIERGLEKVLGRYMPGTSRGHMIYWEGNGQLYKTHDLAQLSDHDALAYVLQVHACIAQCNVQDDLAWLDDKQKLQERMGRPVLAMPGGARRLRLLVCYHPEDFIPISSPDHIKNFLDKLGYTGALPPPGKVVQLMKLLETFFQRAKEQIPRLTRSGFAKGLYSKALGLAPRDTSVAEDDTPEDSIPLNIMLSKSTTPVLNQILFGPPGTGKTYSVVTKALEIVEPQLIAQVQADTGLSLAAQRQKLKQRFDELVEQERIRFTTFHQSFSYEDFVEGIRASVDDGDDGGQPRFVIEKGIFAQLCDAALQNREQDAELGVRDGASVWKVSIGEINGASNTRDYCFAHDEMRVGWPNAGDLATEEYQNNPAFSHHNKNALWAFAKGAQIGDIVLCFASNSSISAVGVVTGDYRHDNSMPDAVRKDFVHVRPVRWLLKNISFSVKELNGNKALVQQTMYELHRITWPRLQEALQAKGFELSSRPTQAANASLPYVLVIDEINRGNVSRIFGELITLIEPSKRAGASEALSITLPYSKQSFTVPSNVYIIGTMNTTDRSLAGLDVALRRRFSFQELLPDLTALDGVVVKDETDAGINVDVRQMLAVMNERIEVLLDREHQIGHAYFMPLQSEPTLERLAQIFHQQILPLLQEYFFDDWERIALVLNDHRKPTAQRFVQEHGTSLDALFGNVEQLPRGRKRWRINTKAFTSLASFARIAQVVPLKEQSQAPDTAPAQESASSADSEIVNVQAG